MRPGVRLLLLLLATSIGCGSPTDRAAVSGTVTLDGEPLAEGTISFTPSAGGHSAGATIAAGRYAIAQADGPSPGRQRVEITAFAPTGKTIEDEDLPGRTQEELRQMIPGRYNVDSTLVADLAPRANQADYSLTKQP